MLLGFYETVHIFCHHVNYYSQHIKLVGARHRSNIDFVRSLFTTRFRLNDISLPFFHHYKFDTGKQFDILLNNSSNITITFQVFTFNPVSFRRLITLTMFNAKKAARKIFIKTNHKICRKTRSPANTVGGPNGNKHVILAGVRGGGHCIYHDSRRHGDPRERGKGTGDHFRHGESAFDDCPSLGCIN